MQRIAHALWQDEAGFVVSAELALVGTIATLGMVTGLAEASSNVHNELHDVGAAVGSLDQSFSYKKTSGEVVSFVDSDHR
jgi:Flp pilus assembly pilin Flp